MINLDHHLNLALLWWLRSILIQEPADYFPHVKEDMETKKISSCMNVISFQGICTWRVYVIEVLKSLNIVAARS